MADLSLWEKVVHSNQSDAIEQFRNIIHVSIIMPLGNFSFANAYPYSRWIVLLSPIIIEGYQTPFLRSLWIGYYDIIRFLDFYFRIGLTV